MVKAIGIDTVDIDRIRRAVQRFGDRFPKRILGDEELAIYRGRTDGAAFLAGRFAGKEAVVKALGRFLTVRPPLQSLQIINDATGQPEMELPADVQEQLGTAELLVSISHERHSAVAMAIISDDR